MIDALAKKLFPSAPLWRGRVRVGVLVSIAATLIAGVILLAFTPSTTAPVLLVLFLLYGLVWVFVDYIP